MKPESESPNPLLSFLEVFEIVIGTFIALLIFLVSCRIALGIWQDWGGH